MGEDHGDFIKNEYEAERENCTGNWATCEADGGECAKCGERDCPKHEPLHYHHDGCPSCEHTTVVKESEWVKK